MDPEIIEITSDEESGAENANDFDRRAILQPVVGRVVDALGGYEGDVYVMGDEVHGCLKDLKKLWRKDESDDERTVARLFWETRVLPNDLVPILLETAGKGLVEDKRAISCVDLMTAMTWPINMAEELKELDDELDKGTDYTQLLASHLHYKLALLKPGVIQALFGIILPPLAKGVKERVPRDGQVINVVLHLIRNLAFIRDLPVSSSRSSDQAELSNLQSQLIRSLAETHMTELLLTIASNTDNDPLFNGWNTLVLEIIYLLYRGVKPGSLTLDQAKQPAENLQRLLALEDRTRRDFARKATSRHSRFGTTISVKLKTDKQPPAASTDDAPNGPPPASQTTRSVILHRQQAIHAEAGAVMDLAKRQRTKKINKLDELGTLDNLSLEARGVLQNFAIEFVESCYNPFLAALLKDIKSERPKITEKDHLRLLYVTKWFLEFFLAMRSKEQQTKPAQERWVLGLIAEVTERSWIIWVLKRMREAVEDKPKLWVELQAGIECLTQLLLLIDNMTSSEIVDPSLKEAAEVLQQQLIYNGEVLDVALESLRSYKPGTQSLAYLDSSVYLAYALLRMLEKWGKEKGNETYVRQKVGRKKKKSRGITEEEGIPDVEDEDEPDDVIHETMFTFEAFQNKFAQAEITQTLLTYLARYHEFASSENMRRVVNLLHRQAVKAKAEGLFFKVSTLDLFKTILADQKQLPREQPYKDLINLINFILRQFFKALSANPFLAVEAFFPKNRGHWKQYSSWEPEAKSRKEKQTVEDTRFPPDIQVKKGYSWSDQLGIAIANLVEANQTALVRWTTEILELVIAQRLRIIEETDKKEQDGDNDEEDTAHSLMEPSAEAASKFRDYLVPYTNDEQADAATKNPRLKLLFRLSKLYVLDEDADELEWYIPSTIALAELQRTLNVINQFLETPYDLGGKQAAALLNRKRRRRRRRSPSPASDADGNLSENEPRRRKRKEKKKAEKEQYKSAQFIQDSDEEYGDMDVFLEKERAKREQAVLAAAAAGLTDRPINMKSTGTKKRRRKGADDGSKSKKRRGSSPLPASRANDSDEEVEFVGGFSSPAASEKSSEREKSTVPRPRPRPRPKVQSRPSSTPASDSDESLPTRSKDAASEPESSVSHARAKRLIISDDED